MKISVIKSTEKWRTSPWMVRYHQDGKPVRRFFETKEEAEQYAREVRQSVRLGAEASDLGEAHRLLAGTGHKLTNIIRAGLQFIRESEAASASPTATFSDGIALILSNTKHCRAKTVAGYAHVFRALEKAFGPRVATTITNADVQNYLDSLPDQRGKVGNASPYTKKTRLVHIRMVLRALGIANPLPKLVARVPRVREIKFFSVAEIRAILAAADPADRGMIALATFAAIRPQTLERLPAECVNLADKMIRLPAELSKDHRAHCLETIPIGTDREVRPGPPEVLWDWLKRFPFQPRSWSALQRRMRRTLNGKWIQDGLRHSGATYYRAKYGDAATAELLTHASINLVNEHYAGLATRAQTDEFFSLTVDSVPAASGTPLWSEKHIQWPTNEELERMLKEKPATEIAAMLGCSDSMLSKRCKKLGIAKPGRGSWSGKIPPPIGET
jgi:integrase